MQSQQTWYPLDLDAKNALRPGFSWPCIKPGTKRMEFLHSNPGEVLSKEWLSFWADRGSRISTVILFWRQAGSDHGWAHIDIDAQQRITTCALNWAYEDGSTQMVWYDPPTLDEIRCREISIAPGNTPSLVFRVDELREVNRCHVGSVPTLVRTDIPHAVRVGVSHRWCISARFEHDRYADWDHAVNDMGDLILDNRNPNAYKDEITKNVQV